MKIQNCEEIIKTGIAGIPQMLYNPSWDEIRPCGSVFVPSEGEKPCKTITFR